MKLEIRDFSSVSVCKYYEKSYSSWTPRFTYTFHPGIYALIGQIINSGWSFTYALSPNRQHAQDEIIYHTIDYSPQYLIDDNTVDIEMLQKTTCDLGYYRPKWYSKLGIRDESGEHRLKKALRKHDSGFTYDELVDKLGLTECRLGRPINHTGNERWRITAAIGLAENKKIFCYPWMTNAELIMQPYAIQMMGECISAAGGILLIPVENAELLGDVVDGIVDLSQPEIFGGEQE